MPIKLAASLAMVLRAWGCDVDLADSGPDALRLVRESAASRRLYGLAILDRARRRGRGDGPRRPPTALAIERWRRVNARRKAGPQT